MKLTSDIWKGIYDCLRFWCRLKHGTEEYPGLIGSKKERVSGMKKWQRWDISMNKV